MRTEDNGRDGGNEYGNRGKPSLRTTHPEHCTLDEDPMRPACELMPELATDIREINPVGCEGWVGARRCPEEDGEGSRKKKRKETKRRAKGRIKQRNKVKAGEIV